MLKNVKLGGFFFSSFSVPWCVSDTFLLLLKNSKHEDKMLKEREAILCDAQRLLCLFDAKINCRKEQKWEPFNLSITLLDLIAFYIQI